MQVPTERDNFWIRTARRNDTNGDSKGVTEHNKDVKLDKVGEFQSKSEEGDQKWKANSLTKTRSGFRIRDTKLTFQLKLKTL